MRGRVRGQACAGARGRGHSKRSGLGSRRGRATGLIGAERVLAWGPPRLSGTASPCPHSSFPRGPSSSTESKNGHHRAPATLDLLSCSQLHALRPCQPHRGEDVGLISVPFQPTPHPSRIHHRKLDAASEPGRGAPQPFRSSFTQGPAQGAWKPAAPRSPGAPPPSWGGKGQIAGVNVPAAGSLSSSLMTPEKKERDRHGGLTGFRETVPLRDAASRLSPVVRRS